MDGQDQWLALGTAAVSDALDRFALRGQCRGIHALGAHSRAAGPAFTVKMEPAGSSGGPIGDYVDDVPPGAVIVIDNGGMPDATVWGALLTYTARRRGIAGTVIHGVCRDNQCSLAEGYPIFANGKFMRTGKGRVQMESVNVPVSAGGVRIEPEDIVVGDADGVVVVPKGCADAVLAAARKIHQAEENIRTAVANGLRLEEARRAFAYHTLQQQGSGKP